MGLLQELENAINNPEQQASSDQLSNILETVQKAIVAQGVNPEVVQKLLSELGSQLRPIFQKLDQSDALKPVIDSTTPDQPASQSQLDSLIKPEAQSQIIKDIAAKTGIDASALHNLLPTLLPAVIGMLGMGASTLQGISKNLILRTFLDADKDGDVDLGDVFIHARKFILKV
jgi:uncharacterized protein YidB (DUF937 family)